ncbi:minor tail protein [Mycobacterium phage Donny]|uniref:Minor tail protein n=3 Tax=Acadianvirus acadian TaxID=1982901 RepID=A0A7M1CP66_9CAUD|nr:minor tail protein [Mycobacterium phage Acadian]AER48945.1 minor tail protein [Mycobacterium phage Acadian]QBI96486.1 minor tail protein [Mycobacterium phage Donny]QOP65573.1 minor tail protein [Mycobacterium phage Suigeneris]WUT94801.1 minor tail protein [Mycobacterium phage PRodriguez]
MPIYIGDAPIDDILSTSEADDYDKVYIGSDLVWPPIEFPYSVINSNVSAAAIPPGATGAWIELWGRGANGGTGGHDDSTQSSGHAAGGNGGGGGGHVHQIFVYVEDMGTDWSLLYGAVNRFLSGGVDLVANSASGTNGGTASVSGLTADYYSPRASNGGNRGQNSDGAGAGGADGGDSDWTGDNAPNTSPPGTRGLGTNGGTNGGTGGTAHGSGNAHHYASGGGGGGGGGYTAGQNGGAGTQNNGGAGGSGGVARAEVTWVNTPVPKDKTWTFGAGAWSWTCPAWAQNGWKVDILEWAGGKAGANGGSTSAGNGGLAGATNSQTLTVGTEIAIGGTLSGNVGAGGASNGANGGNTTCTQLGHNVLGATGNTGAQDGQAAGPITIGGKTYPGGPGGTSGSSSSAGQDGSAPGGGGEGGGSLFFVGLAGGKGGDGRVIIRLREV